MTHRRAIALMLLVTLPGLLVGVLMSTQTSHHMERRVLISSDETWRRAVGNNPDFAEPVGLYAYVVPTLGGEPRIAKPPLTVILSRLAFIGLDPHTVSADVLMQRIRAVAVGMSAILLIATYLIATNLHPGPMASTAGILAGMTLGTSMIIQRWGRVGGYDIHLAAWTTLTIALVLIATRSRATTTTLLAASDSSAAPINEPRMRWGWIFLAGLTATLAIYSKGPVGFLFISVPLLIVAGFDGLRRWRLLMALPVVLLMPVILAGPWFVYVFMTVDQVGEGLAFEYESIRDRFAPVWAYVVVFALMLPWTVLLIAGLIHPWVLRFATPHSQEDREEQTSRRPLWIAGSWLLLMLVILSLPSAKQERYVLPILPAAGLVIAFLALSYDRLLLKVSDQTPAILVRGVSFVMRLHGVVVVVVSLLIYGWLLIGTRHEAMNLGVAVLFFYWAAGASLVVFAGWVALRVGRVGVVSTVLATAVWVGVSMPVYWSVYLPVAGGVDPVRETALEVRRLAGDRAIEWVMLPGVSGGPDEKLMVFSRRVVRVVALEEVSEGSLVLAKSDPISTETLDNAGFSAVSLPIKNRSSMLEAWVREEASPQ
ncbi:ArnT family glycosyltransferase [Mucisphaera sp.]|uniref:ArnT family glycosyltransferase n=1 Tax=Mucisphaera sp. TaxID=2913024 RepID=UPI003D09BE7E